MGIVPDFIVNKTQIQGFVIIYLVSFIPCWISLFLAARAIIKGKISSFIAWSFLLLLLLLSPYAFLLVYSSYNIWQLWAVIVLVTLFSYYRLFFLNNKLSIQWFWDWYSKSYDTLLLFGPYKDLIYEIGTHSTRGHNKKIRILEIGCGTGNIAWQIRDNENIEYLGVDSSKSMLQKAKNKLKDFSNFVFVEKEVESELHSINEQFDVIIINNVLYALQDHLSVIKVVRKLVNSDGRLIISEPLRNSSIGFLLKQYFIKHRSKAAIQIILHLPSFVFLLIGNLMILEIDHIKEKNFFDANELSEILINNSFDIELSKNVYEQQNILFVAIPA